MMKMDLMGNRGGRGKKPISRGEVVVRVCIDVNVR